MNIESDLYLAPETACGMYGHVLIDHDLLGRACARCGGFDPTWQLSDDGAYYPER